MSEYDPVSDILDFALKHSQIVAVSKGNDPEYGAPSYYLLTSSSSSFDFDLADKITSLDLDVAKKMRESGNPSYLEIMQWPLRDPKEYGFLGKIIWKREIAA